ncbi:MAG: hypothetical protein LV479_09700 [Methylacidiphilales bacterium]|nr:hypothetical protein [Candidatus Methylacidiphilales bacterium]
MIKIWTKKELARAIELRLQRRKWAEIAEILGRSESALWVKLSELEIKIRANGRDEESIRENLVKLHHELLHASAQEEAAAQEEDEVSSDSPESVAKTLANTTVEEDIEQTRQRILLAEARESKRKYHEVPAATAQFFHGAWTDDSDNGYWQETTRTLIDAALSICLIVRGRLETDMAVRFLMNWLVAKRPSPDDNALLTGFEAMATVASGHVNSNLLGKIEHVRATIDMWNKLDPRTKGILNSCLLDALGPLISLETRRYLDPSRGLSFVPEDIVSGKIMVFSLAAGRNLESASLLGRILKSRLYVALQGRPQVRNQRLCVIHADEYHYLASGGTDRASDVTALATLRSRSVGLVAD